MSITKSFGKSRIKKMPLICHKVSIRQQKCVSDNLLICSSTCSQQINLLIFASSAKFKRALRASPLSAIGIPSHATHIMLSLSHIVIAMHGQSKSFMSHFIASMEINPPNLSKLLHVFRVCQMHPVHFPLESWRNTQRNPLLLSTNSAPCSLKMTIESSCSSLLSLSIISVCFSFAIMAISSSDIGVLSKPSSKLDALQSDWNSLKESMFDNFWRICLTLYLVLKT